MSKDFSDFTHACARAKHPRGETVPQQVGPLKNRVQPCSIERSSNDSRYCRRPSKARARRLHANKHPTRFAFGAIRAQIGCESRADIHGQWHPVVQQALAANQDLAGPPIDIIKLEGNDFASAEAEAGEQEKDGVVAASSRCLPVAASITML